MMPHLSYGAGKVLTRSAPPRLNIKRLSLFLLLALIVAAVSIACRMEERQSGIPAAAQDIIDTFTEDFNSGRFDKIYSEAADEWRGRVTREQSAVTFGTMKERLGEIRERTYTSGRRQQNPGGNLPANSLVIRYNTRFDRAEGMETFTLIERDGRIVLAGYSVNSNALQQ